MTRTYDTVPPEYVWLEDGIPVVGDRYAFDRAVAQSDVAVRGLWRLTVLTEDGEDVTPVLVAVVP